MSLTECIISFNGKKELVIASYVISLNNGNNKKKVFLDVECKRKYYNETTIHTFHTHTFRSYEISVRVLTLVYSIFNSPVCQLCGHISGQLILMIPTGLCSLSICNRYTYAEWQLAEMSMLRMKFRI